MMARPTAPLVLPSMRWGSPRAGHQALLLHGLTSSGACWWRIAEGLAARGWRVTAPDLRGHGAAPPAEDFSIAAISADVSGVEDLTRPSAPWGLVVGHSLGGAVATAVAARHPGWATGLLLLDPVITLPGDVEGLVQEGLEELSADVVTIARDHPRWHPEDVRLKELSAGQTGPAVVESFFRTNAGVSQLSELASITCPVTVLAADPSLGAAFTEAEALQVGERSPDFRWRVLEGVGHSVHRDVPEVVLRAIEEQNLAEAPR